MSDPVFLNGLGLSLGFVAAFLLAFFPPPQWAQATKEGAAKICWTGRVSGWGKVLYWLSYSGPLLLAISFALQFIAWWQT